jgi:hypothetical protein
LLLLVRLCWQLTESALLQQQRRQLWLLKGQWRLRYSVLLQQQQQQLLHQQQPLQQQQLWRWQQHMQQYSQLAVLDLTGTPAWEQKAVACAHTAAQHAVR